MNKVQIKNATLYNADCLIENIQILSGSVDLIITDLPYGTMKGANLDGWKGVKTDWDVMIPIPDIMQIANRILRKNGKMILFAQQPFTTKLIVNQIPNLPHCYNMYWDKMHFANALFTNKAPVSYIEDILVFSKSYDLEGLHPLRTYFKLVMDFIGLNLKQINNKLGHRKAEHTFYINSTQYELCVQKTYDELINVFGIDKMEGFKTFIELESINSTFNSTFNLGEGEKYKSNILKYKKDFSGFHPTQKPVALLEDLIKTFSNKNNLVVDLTMGSGSAGIACAKGGRKFIGIEKDENYYDVAVRRCS